MTQLLQTLLVALALAPITPVTTAIVAVIEDWTKHFVLAFCLGLLAYWLTWIILYACLRVWERLTRREASTVAGFGMTLCPLLVSLSLALLSHWALDYAYILWATPLGPALLDGGMHLGLDLTPYLPLTPP